MNAKAWERKVKRDLQRSGTYQPFYSCVIESLARILEQRDKALQEFDDSGRQYVTEHINRNGERNTVTNPILTAVRALDKIALSYIRDLGLTPAAYRRIAAAPDAGEHDSFSATVNLLDSATN